MKKLMTFFCTTLLASGLMAYSDSDLDGVADAQDKCPNTPLMDLVDINGCSIKKLKPKEQSQHHFDVIVGANYTGSNYTSTPQTNNYSSSLQVDYYYKDFSLQAIGSYYKVDSDTYSESGWNDTFVGAAYTLHPLKNFSLRLGAGALLPTYKTTLNNNNTDYIGSLNASYTVGKVNIFAGYSYTQVNDDDVAVELSDGSTYYYRYQNTNAYSAGLGYYISNKLYVNGAYNITESIYQGVEKAKTVSAYAYYSINAHWFVNASYAYGLSESASDNAASLKLGYYF